MHLEKKNKMKIQSDSKKRVVALTNLEAMCDRISGVCHTFEVVKVTANCVHVQYSNPDEYGNPEPITAVFPAYPLGWGDDGNCHVVLDPIKYNGCTGKNEESWQAFQQLYDCPELFRSAPHLNDWQSREEIEQAKAKA